MSDKSKIEWTDATWNPVRGCTKISPGCTHCYAETFAERFRGVPGHPFEFGFDLRLVPEKLGEPLRWVLELRDAGNASGSPTRRIRRESKARSTKQAPSRASPSEPARRFRCTPNAPRGSPLPSPKRALGLRRSRSASRNRSCKAWAPSPLSSPSCPSSEIGRAHV